jgi:hypothetical protein
LEVLDYLSNSEIVNLPCLAIQAMPLGPDGRELAAQAEESLFSVRSDAGPHSAGRRFGVGSEQKLAGRRILFWMSGSGEETEAFRQSKPAGPLGKLGAAVLYAGGKPYDLSIGDWKPGTRRPLGDSGLEAELVGVDSGQLTIQGDVARDVQVRLNIHRGSTSHPLLLSAEFPHLFSRPDYDDNVFGAYWPGPLEAPKEDSPPLKTNAGGDEKPSDPPVEASAAQPAAAAKSDFTAKVEPKKPDDKAEAKKPDDKADSQAKAAAEPEARPIFGPPRIEFFQGADRQLYLRTFRAGQVKVNGPLKMTEGGGFITAFPGTPDTVALWFGDFQPADRPDFSARALAFENSDDPHLHQAKLRLTVDGRHEEFWMPCCSPDPLEKKQMDIPLGLQQKTVPGEGRSVKLSFAPESFHLGYTIDLHKAWRKLDPGSKLDPRTKPSFFGSEIDLLPNEYAVKSSAAGRSGDPPPECKNLLVTLNAPLDFADPGQPGRSYRMFQATMSPPYNPEDFGGKPGETVYLSGFRLNYDPGRGLTYVGCLLVVAGIFVAYFVRFVKK